MQFSRLPSLLLIPLIWAAPAGCGKKGPPLPPIIRAPDRVTGLTARRQGNEVLIRFTIPSTNANGLGPADIERVDIYAYTGTPAGDETVDMVKEASVIGSVKVRKPPEPEPEQRRSRDRKDQEPPPPPPPPEPKPPGTYDQGEIATITETLTPALMAPDRTALEAREKMGRRAAPAFRAFPWPGPLEVPKRYYAAVAVSGRGRKSGLSQRAVVPMFSAASAPTIFDYRYTEAAISLLLEPPPDAPRPIQGGPPQVVAATPGAVVAPGTPPAKSVPAVEPLSSRSIAPSRLPVGYNVYDTKPVTPVDPLPPDFVVDLTKPVNQQPLSAPLFVDTRPFEFGTERCYIARTVTTIGSGDTTLSIESEPSEEKCVPLPDVFPPAPPRNLAAVGGEGVISLIWEPSTEKDLAGYLVLRGDAPGEKLLPLTPEPIRESTFRDTTAKPGVRYVYVVQAVDNATPPNVSQESNRVEESAR